MRKRHPLAEEPLTFSGNDIANLLHHSGYTRFASYVRQMDRQVRDINRLEASWAAQLAEMVKRLHQYEPPAPLVNDRGGKPGPMSDG
jgi:hypothetical protein